MKNTTKLLGIFAILTIVSFLLVACDNGSDSTPDPDIFTVTFNSNGGSAVPSQGVPDGGKAAKPKGVSQQVNFALEGWYIDNNTFENKWNFDIDTVIENITLYARWQAVSPLDYEDFGPMLVTTTYTVANAAHWKNTVEAISNGGDDKAYIINITGNFSVEGESYNNYTFGEINDVTVSLRSDGKTITLSGDEGNIKLLKMGNSQNLIIRSVNLKGYNSYNTILVYVDEGNFTMHGGEISRINSSELSSESDGVYINKGTFTMHNGKISGNNCCGVYIPEGTFIMYNGEISGNEYCGINIKKGSFTIHNGKVSGNNGKGVKIDSSYYDYNTGKYVYPNDGYFIMYDGEISGNKDYGVDIRSTFTMHDGEIFNNGYGVDASIFIMHNGKISNNEGTGVWANVFTMFNGEISGNNEYGVCVSNGGAFILNNGIIKENLERGVVFWGGECSFIMNGGTISSNTGGGVAIGGGNYVVASSSFTMNGGTICNNFFNGYGGGVFVNHGDNNFTMNGGTISGNTAADGGGVYVYGTSSFTMSGGIISGNTAQYGGGGVSVRVNFIKYGGIIYGKNEGINSNIVFQGIAFMGGNIIFGHAVLFQNEDYFYKDTTLGEDDYISTSSELPENPGETLNGWTRR